VAERPRVSIIIPHYGHGRFLVAAVNSALAQTYENLEVLVVDDCDPDDLAQALLNEVADTRLRIIQHETNQGAAAARNSGINQATGDLILPLDSDDLLNREYLEKTLPFFDDDTAGGVYTGVQLFGLEERIISEDWDVLNILKGLVAAQACLLFRKAIWKQLGGYDTKLVIGEDSDFYLRALLAGFRFVRIAEPLYHYRRHDTSTCLLAPGVCDAEQATAWYVKASRMFPELYAEHLSEIVKSKEKKHWTLQSEYHHLHAEFHKLLTLYNALESSQRLQTPRRALWRRCATRLKNILS
jgi:glycosyltransferase involved in cell wall biosynthesis